MQKEAQPVLDKLKNLTVRTVCGKQVYTGELFGKAVGIVVCGVGKVNAACGTQYAIDSLGADEIINIGVAGGLTESVKVGGIYCISKAVQYDYDLTQLNGTAIGTLDECKENYLNLKSGGYPERKLATGDRFSDSRDDYKLLTEVLAADIRDMEGAAIAQVCMHANVPLRSFKIISDLAGSGSTTEQYLKNLTLCFKTLDSQLEKITELIYG